MPGNQGPQGLLALLRKEKKKALNIFQLAATLPQQKYFLLRQKSDTAQRGAKDCLISARPGSVCTSSIITPTQPRVAGLGRAAVTQHRCGASSLCSTDGWRAAAVPWKSLKHPSAATGLDCGNASKSPSGCLEAVLVSELPLCPDGCLKAASESSVPQGWVDPGSVGCSLALAQLSPKHPERKGSSHAPVSSCTRGDWT